MLLESHLRGCACCRAYAEDLEVVTEILRTTPVGRPRGRFHVPVGSARNNLLHRATRLPRPRLPARIGMARVVKLATSVAVALIAFGVVSNAQAPDTLVGALEVQTAHERISVKEKILDQLEGSEATQARQISNGLQSEAMRREQMEAAERRTSTSTFHCYCPANR